MRNVAVDNHNAMDGSFWFILIQNLAVARIRIPFIVILVRKDHIICANELRLFFQNNPFLLF